MERSFGEFLDEKVSKSQLDNLERYLDELFATVGMDIEFTRHFLDRVNDRDITLQEIREIFEEMHKSGYGRWGKESFSGLDAIIKDKTTSIETPFVLQWNKEKGEVEFVAKTIFVNKGNMTSKNTKGQKKFWVQTKSGFQRG
jgi:hypothetical protein